MSFCRFDLNAALSLAVFAGSLSPAPADFCASGNAANRTVDASLNEQTVTLQVGPSNSTNRFRNACALEQQKRIFE